MRFIKLHRAKAEVYINMDVVTTLEAVPKDERGTTYVSFDAEHFTRVDESIDEILEMLGLIHE